MSGVRILNQEFFETLISFIISQNKQRPHIKKIVADISAKYGDYAGEVKGVPMYTFPDVSKLAKAEVEDLKELKTLTLGRNVFRGDDTNRNVFVMKSVPSAKQS